MSNPKTAFIFGLGYFGSVLARHLLELGWRVRGTKREAVDIEGIEVFAFEANKPLASPKEAFSGVTHVVSTIGLVDGEDSVLGAHGEDLQHLDWVGYISATSVYSESEGGWVTESSPTEAQSQRGQLRRRAEIAWQDNLVAEVFRAAGIYGVGRSPFGDLLAGKARIIKKAGHAFNRIHVEDMARVVTVAMEQPEARRILNLADGAPCESGEVVRYAAELLGVAPPEPTPFSEADLSPMARSFYATSRKVDSSKIKRDLGIDLLYPDYRSGLRAILEGERKAGLL